MQTEKKNSGKIQVPLKKQKENETLKQFWHTLTGLAAKCEFGEQTESIVMNTLIQDLNNKTVQERLCMEPKADPQEVFRFAVAYEARGEPTQDIRRKKRLQGN